MVLNYEIITLEYSQNQGCFHYNFGQELANKSWVKLCQISLADANAFIEKMEKKYVKGRKSGRLPELAVINLELSLFIQLKNTRRRLVGRL